MIAEGVIASRTRGSAAALFPSAARWCVLAVATGAVTERNVAKADESGIFRSGMMGAEQGWRFCGAARHDLADGV